MKGVAARIPLAMILCASLAPSVSDAQVVPLREVVIGATLESELTFVNFLVPLRDSTLVVAQPVTFQLKLFNWRGELVQNVGRRGSGPGEFRSVGYIGRFSAGGFWATDGRLGTIGFYNQAGVLVRSVHAGGIAVSRPLMLIGHDTMVVLRRATVGAEIVPIDVQSGVAGEPWLAYRLPPARPPVRVSTARGRATVYNPIADSPIVEGAVDGSGILHVTRRVAMSAATDSFRVRVLGLGGVRADRWISYRPEAIEEKDLERIIESAAVAPMTYAQATNQQLSYTAVLADIRESMWIPPRHPPVTDARLAADGHVWLRRESNADSVLWEVYSPDLERLVASFILPHSSQVRAVDGAHIWVAEFGALEEPMIVRYAVPGVK